MRSGAKKEPREGEADRIAAADRERNAPTDYQAQILAAIDSLSRHVNQVGDRVARLHERMDALVSREAESAQAVKAFREEALKPGAHVADLRKALDLIGKAMDR